ncbi:MAG TPA: riboflavin biosynthesis protein RibF [Opitutae bacterium]|nr:riboflavin biosynthesis protein RibF [Opitutae bacterium]
MNFPLCVQDFDQLAELQAELHLAIGVFDGVHLGHKAVIESAVFSARRSGGVSGVLTFDPHPSRLFRPDNPTLLMMGIEAKVAMLHQVGVNLVISKKFDREFAAIPADSFLAELKQALPTLKAIYVGQNFRFGQKRLGDVGTLIASGRELGLSVFSVERIQHNGEPISSTRIRKELEEGEIDSVDDLFGYNYNSIGTIIGGAKLGRQIGFPTLNLPWNPECRPRFGVYQVRFREVGHTIWLNAVANYGIKPTVAASDQTPALEIHALESCTLGEGAEVEVEWLRFIRPEQKFDSVDALKEQIAKDCAAVRALL